MARILLDNTTIDKPSKEKIKMGDLAINCKDGEELIVLKNNKDELCSFSTDEVIKATFEQIIKSAGFNENGEYVVPTDEIIKDTQNLSEADSKLAEAINTTNTNVSDLTTRMTAAETNIGNALTKADADAVYLAIDGTATRATTADSANKVAKALTIKSGDTTVEYDGSESKTLEVSSGSVYSLPTATYSVLGGVKIGSGISIDDNGTISVSGGSSTSQHASKDDYGIVKIGEGIDVDEGVISCKTQLSPASKTSIGGVIIGDGISIDTDGKISSLDYATTEITNDNGPFYSVTNYGEYFTCQLNSSPTLYGSIDWLTCGNIVKFVNVDALNINLPFYICTPDYECEHDLDSGYRYVRTPTKFGTNKLHKMTLADMRQLVGKTFYLINANTSGAIAVYYGVEMIENKTDNINYLSCKTSPTDNDYNSIGIPANGGIVKIECCRGAYKSSDELTYECIYWKWEGGIQNSLTEFKDNVTE